MKFPVARYVFVTGLLAVFLAPSQPANAHDYRLGPLRIDHPWATATPKGAKVGAGYMKITNDGLQADRLVAITTPISRKATMHASIKEGDVVKMRPLEQGIEIKPGETIELKPGGSHVMFEGLGAPLTAGARIRGQVIFEKAGTIDVEYTVEPIGTKAAPPAPGAHSH